MSESLHTSGVMSEPELSSFEDVHETSNDDGYLILPGRPHTPPSDMESVSGELHPEIFETLVGMKGTIESLSEKCTQQVQVISELEGRCKESSVLKKDVDEAIHKEDVKIRELEKVAVVVGIAVLLLFGCVVIFVWSANRVHTGELAKLHSEMEALRSMVKPASVPTPETTATPTTIRKLTGAKSSLESHMQELLQAHEKALQVASKVPEKDTKDLELEKENARLKEEHTQLLISLRQQAEQLDAKTAKQAEMNRAAEKTVAKLTDIAARKQEELESLSDHISEQNEKLALLEDQLTSLRTESDSQLVQIATLKADLQQAKSLHQQCKKDLEESRVVNDIDFPFECPENGFGHRLCELIKPVHKALRFRNRQ